ncbi:MerR family transcriptional regulator [Bosea sp. (in: a-proteobacteria)]|uniref:MerR family transcriptional regulator n=1 Tax=Bosea sp. (in: a-proteobacteria) TaxID=1871050 RepID=UPI002B476968|nr:MerR family transcriptional regulator [Bosea sp. (in: a-proteobacteria)]WRH60037.1 MAG: MerR family transcriptional regulator [Bosea sp. (in: a-proteobacteria)]
MYLIREMSEEFGLTKRAIRFYEQKGLLKPSRDTTMLNVPRVYNDEDRARLAEIVMLTKMGFTLNEIASGNISADQYRQQLVLCVDKIVELQESIVLLEERLRNG